MDTNNCFTVKELLENIRESLESGKLTEDSFVSVDIEGVSKPVGGIVWRGNQRTLELYPGQFD